MGERNFIHDQRGATAIEYALIAGLLSIVIMGSIFYFGGGVEGLFVEIREAISG